MALIADTIIAQCTPSGSGALCLLRLSGPNALRIAHQCAQLSRISIDQAPSHTIHYGYIIDAARKPIDQVLFLVMHAPRTFTGEHTIEITCHNNPLLIQQIINRFIECGARHALAGEFSQQAVLNKKIDLVQAETINELIHAQTQEALQVALSQLEGSLSHTIKQLEEKLVQALALTNASFEFIDEEHLQFGNQVKTLLASVLQEVSGLLAQGAQQRLIRQGIRVALIGSVNAGKSSLFNALVGLNRAIVSAQPGTTRDVIEYTTIWQQRQITFIDTAGIRRTEDTIEQEGIERSLQEAEAADIILLVIDSSEIVSSQQQMLYNDLLNRYKETTLAVYSKKDLAPDTIFSLDHPSIQISVQDQSSIETLRAQLGEIINNQCTTQRSAFLLNKRHLELLTAFEQELRILNEQLQQGYEYEIIAWHLQKMLQHLAQMTGKDAGDRAMDAIFRQFCIGK